MTSRLLRQCARLGLLVVALGTARESGAQAWAYPAFQPPRLTVREYNFAMADAGGPGTSLVFQWREQSGERQQFSFDAGLADPDGNADVVIFGGVGWAWLTSPESEEVPLAFVLTAGAYASVGDRTRLRLPIGVSVGHAFDLGNGMILLPYAHPRLTMYACNGCGGTELGVSFDLGANLELSRTISIRASGLFSGTETIADEGGFGVSVVWTPPSLLRRR